MKKIKKIILTLVVIICLSATGFVLSGCFSTDYSITVDSSVSNVMIVPSKTKASEGEQITLSYEGLNPKFQFNHFIVNGSKIAGNTFTMPNKNVEVSASLTQVVFSISYNLGQGETTEGITSYKINDAETVLADASKDGCVFMGWYETSDFQGDRVVAVRGNDKKNYNLYPKFISVEMQGSYRMITSPVDFVEIISANLTGKYRLKNDIDFSGFKYEPIGGQVGFSGELDGNGKTIKNVDLSNASDEFGRVGLFTTMSQANVYSLKLEGFTANKKIKNNFGALAGYVANSVLNGVEVTNSKFIISSSNTISVGGVVGYVFKSDIICVFIETTELNVSSEGAVYSGLMFGHINEITMFASYAHIDKSISITTSKGVSVYFGGFAGREENNSNISNCYVNQKLNSKVAVTNTANSLGSSIYCGGLIGDFRYNSILRNCYSSLHKFELKNLNGEDSFFGGIVAMEMQNSVVENCFVVATKGLLNMDAYIQVSGAKRLNYISYSSKERNNYVDSKSSFINGSIIETDNVFDKNVVKRQEYAEFIKVLKWDKNLWDFSNDKQLPVFKLAV